MQLLRRILISLVGGTVLLMGIAMIVLPGPAILVIPAGLAILAIEFAWARHWLHKNRVPFFRQSHPTWAVFDGGEALPPARLAQLSNKRVPWSG